MNGQTAFLTNFWSRWKNFMERLISITALMGIYFLGIGLTSLVAKVFQWQFLNRNFKNSSWQSVTGSSKITKMF